MTWNKESQKKEKMNLKSLCRRERRTKRRRRNIDLQADAGPDQGDPGPGEEPGGIDPGVAADRILV